MKLRRKNVTVEVAYFVGKEDPKRGIFRGGPQMSPFLNELIIDSSVDEVYDESSDTLKPSGKMQLNLYGTKRAYMALAQYLLSLCELETADPDYHDHWDDIRNSDGKESIHLIMHAPIGKAE
jgi:hypothetical protein